MCLLIKHVSQMKYCSAKKWMVVSLGSIKIWFFFFNVLCITPYRLWVPYNTFTFLPQPASLHGSILCLALWLGCNHFLSLAFLLEIWEKQDWERGGKHDKLENSIVSRSPARKINMHQSLTSGISFPLGQTGLRQHMPTLFCPLMFQWLREVKVAQSCPTLCDLMGCSPWNSPGQNTEVGNLSLLKWIFLTQKLNQGLLHCRRILYQLSYQESPLVA